MSSRPLRILSFVAPAVTDIVDFQDNLWFFTDFLHARLNMARMADQTSQEWYSVVDIFQYLRLLQEKNSSPHYALHGAPNEPRTELFKSQPSSPLFYKVQSRDMWHKVMQRIIQISSQCTHRDHLLLLFFCHGYDRCGSSEHGDFEIGTISGTSTLFSPGDLERCLGECKARVTLFTTSCFASKWVSKSSSWNLVAASRNLESYSLPTSASGRAWGSPLTAAIPELLAQTYGTSLYPPSGILPQECPRTTERNIDDPTLEKLENVVLDLYAQAFGLTSADSKKWYLPLIDSNESVTGLTIMGVYDKFEHQILQQCFQTRLTHVSPNPASDTPHAQSGATRPTPRRSASPVVASVDSNHLHDLIAHWKRTSGCWDTLPTRQSLKYFNAISSYAKGQLDEEQVLRLYQGLVNRERLDIRAQAIAEAMFPEIIPSLNSCRDFTDGAADVSARSVHPSWDTIMWTSVRWGQLTKPDVIFDKNFPPYYHKPSRWVWYVWRESGTGLDGLNVLLTEVRGGIIKEQN